MTMAAKHRLRRYRDESWCAKLAAREAGVGRTEIK